MRPTEEKTFSRRIYPRLAADFALVHLCALAAWACAATSYSVLGQDGAAHAVATYFPRYYWAFFWPLSFLFPAVFLLSGFYTRAHAYADRYKAVVLLRGAGLAILLFLAANYLLFRDELVSRSVAIWFSCLVTVVVTGARFIKGRFARQAERPRRDLRRTGSDARTVLVVGGAGYVGSILTRRLLDKGYKVRVLDSLVYGYAPIRDALDHPNVRLIVGDCRNIQSVVSAVRGVDTIVHLAAIVGDPACEQDRQTALETNYAATRMLIEVAKGYGVRRFIFASSCSVYGATDYVVDERSAVSPISLYAQTKISSEDALLRARSESFHPTILRLATVFGYSYRPRFDLVVNLLTAKAFQEGVITIYNGQQWRPFIHVRDVTEGILSAMEAPLVVVSGQIFNVGSSRLNYTLSDVAEQIQKVFPQTRVEHIENSDRRNYRVSFEKIRNQLGFQCRETLEEGIVELKQAFDGKEIADYRDAYYDNKKYLQMAGSPGHVQDIDAGVMAAFSAGLLTVPTLRMKASWHVEGTQAVAAS